jgi:hypothetical protein
MVQKLIIGIGCLCLFILKQCPTSTRCITCNSAKDTLWKFVMKRNDKVGNHPKFTLLSKCVTIEGTLVDTLHANSDDGDASIFLKLDIDDSILLTSLDPSIKKMSTSAIECEIIWVDTTNSYYKQYVSGHYKNHFKLSDYYKTEKISVSGMLVIDSEGHPQYEIHPVFDIRKQRE